MKLFSLCYSILRLLNSRRIKPRERTITAMMMSQDHSFPASGSFTFIPKKLATRVGGMRSREMRVKIFII